MSKIEWDASGKHYFETGVSKGVLYPMSDIPGTYANGVAWNGLVSISESAEGAEPNAIYADNIKYLNLLSVEEFNATIEAYTYPDEFKACDGESELVEGSGVYVSQQARKSFALSYQTKIGNDLNPELGYKIHIIYGATAQPSERSYETVNDSPEAITFSWEVSTVPVELKAEGFKPVAHLVIDSTKCTKEKLDALQAKLYGSESSEATLMLPDEIIALLKGTTQE